MWNHVWRLEAYFGVPVSGSAHQFFIAHAVIAAQTKAPPTNSERIVADSEIENLSNAEPGNWSGQSPGWRLFGQYTLRTGIWRE
jgi:hypothetical protein